MATLTVLKFSTPEGAANMLEKIKGLQKMELIKLQDAAIVTWPQGQKAPKTKQLVDMAGMGAMQGAFWGMLFGLIFFVPYLWSGGRCSFWCSGRQDRPITVSMMTLSRRHAKKSPRVPRPCS